MYIRLPYVLNHILSLLFWFGQEPIERLITGSYTHILIAYKKTINRII